MPQGFGSVNFNFPKSRTSRDWYGPATMPGLQDIMFGQEEDEEEDPLSEANQYLGYTDPNSSAYLRRMNEVMGQAQPAMQRYTEHLANIPQRDNYKPNIWTKIAAALAGVSAGIRGGAGEGIKVGQATRMLPWQEAYDDWENQTQGLGAAATMEQAKMKQILDDLQKMEDARIKQENTNVAKAGAKARLSTAGSYRKMVDQPNYDLAQTGDSSFLYNSKDPSTRISLGDSPTKVTRQSMEKEGGLNRSNAMGIANLQNEGAMARTMFSGLFGNNNRNTTYRTISPADRMLAEAEARFKIATDPEFSRLYSEFFEEDPAYANIDKPMPFPMLRLKPPPAGASAAQIEKYRKLQILINDTARAGYSVQIPSSVPGGR